MRTVVGLLAAHLLLTAVGTALLYALDLLELRARAVLAAAGPALLAGVALVMPLLVLLVVAGVPATLPTVCTLAVAAVAALALAGRLRRRARPVPSGSVPRVDTGRWVPALLILVGTFFVLRLLALRDLPIIGDDAYIWSLKALVLFHHGGLEPHAFLGAQYIGSALDHPILQPLYEAIMFRASGGEHLALGHPLLWILFGAFVWTVVWLLRPGGWAVAALAPVGALLVSPAAFNQVAAGYADVTVGSFVGAGVLCLGIFLDRRQPGYLLLGAAFLAAAANTKNEGLVAALLVLPIGAGIALARAPRTGIWLWGAAGGVVLAGALPWQLWLSSHDVHNKDLTPLSDTLSFDFLGTRIDRLRFARAEVFSHLGNQGEWLWIVPAFVATCVIVWMFARTLRSEVAFYALTAFAMTAALLWVYWTSRADITFQLYTSSGRTITGIVFVAAVGIAHLVAGSLGRPANEATEG